MSSESDLSFEAFLRDNFDIDMASGDSNSNDTLVQHHGDDYFQMLDPALSHMNPIDYEALQQSYLDIGAAVALCRSELGPWSSDVTRNLPMLHESGFDVDAPCEVDESE